MRLRALWLVGGLLVATALPASPAAPRLQGTEAPRQAGGPTTPDPTTQDLRGILPDEAVLVVEVAAPALAVAALAATLGDVPRGLPAEVVTLLGAGLAAGRTALGAPVAEWAAQLGAGGAVFGALPAGGSLLPLVVARPGDRAAALQWCERFAGRLHFAADGDLLLLSSSRAGVDLLRTRRNAPASRWAAAGFGPAPATVAPVLRGLVDLVGVRRLLGDKAPRMEDLDGGGRFLLAPLVQALATGRWLQFDVTADSALTIAARIDASVLGTVWEGLLPGKETARPSVPLATDGLALVTVDRSFRALLGQLERYLPPADVLAAQSFLSIADVLDGANTSFVDDLLGGLREPFALHVLAAEPPAAQERPPLLLPGLAIVVPIAVPAVETILQRFAQVFATIANGERKQRGQPPFVLRTLRGEHGQGLVAEAPPWRGPGAPPVESALSPTLLCGHGHAVLASTQRAAEQVLAAAATESPPSVLGDLVVLRGPALAAAIAASRSVLELGRVLDEGEEPAAARRFFDVAIAVADAVQQAALRMQATATETRLELSLERRR